MLNRTTIAALATLAGLTSVTSASLVITEVAPQTTSGTVTAINGDWWELTNAGSTSVNLAGYKWADTEDQIGGPTPQPNIFPSVVISPGESIIILEEGLASEAAWLSNWGAPSTLNILGTDEMLPTPPATDNFSGLGSANDGVFLYDPSNNLLGSYLYAANTRGVSFEIATDGSNLGLSVVGENFAVRAANGDIGSPGVVVPEPTAMAGLLLASAALFRRRGA
jgi:hypothetical protein